MQATIGRLGMILKRKSLDITTTDSISKAILLLLTSIFFASCMSRQILPSPSITSSIQSVEIMAMEPPPLIVTRGVINPGALSGATGPGAGALMLVYGVVALTKGLNDHKETTIISNEYRDILSRIRTWNPSLVLARQAADILRSSGKRNIILRQKYVEVPAMENRETTLLMENWYAPIRAWYNADPSLMRYEMDKGINPDAILEIGILNYELYEDHFLLQVMIKLIDPRTGRVIGRTRITEMAQVHGAEDLFMRDAAGFKDTFSALGLKSLKESLNRLCLLN